MARPRTNEPLNVLLIGGGGREHALAWRLSQSGRLGSLWISHPENPGLAALGKPMGVPFRLDQLYRVEQFCRHQRIDLAVVGPEDPLAAGVADALRKAGCAVFGPGREGARLESDKAWAKQFMRQAAIPTADGRVFTDPEAAKEFLRSRETPHVVKASGLAKGKGVFVPDTLDEAMDAVDRIMVRRDFGAAGDSIVVEERITGPELSVLALTDGNAIYVLEPCRDHKRLHEGDVGPNTGGMGAFSPVAGLRPQLLDRVEREIFLPLVDSLRREGIEYRGVLYAGLMLTHAGPKVLEFNVRFGDPECQPLMARWTGDLLDTLHKTATGQLVDARIDWDPRAACCVVLASEGYPEQPKTGAPIEGIDVASAMDGVMVFHAGTRRDADGAVITAGGRVLGVTAMGDSLDEARERALAACDVIHFEGKQLRRDIGAGAPAHA